MTDNTEFQIFCFKDAFPVRITDRDGAPWFVAADVCRALEISNPRDAINRLDDDEHTTVGFSDGRPGHGAQKVNIISESGLYALIIRSSKPAAREFRKWITAEVLPTIRRTGAAPDVVPADLVTVVDGQAVTTSLKVAEVFGKQHQHVLRAIRELEIPDDYRQSNFGETVYYRPNPSGGKPIAFPMYQITRDGFTLLVMGFTGKKAMQFKLAYIAAFNAMEAALRSGARGNPVGATDADLVASTRELLIALNRRSVEGNVPHYVLQYATELAGGLGLVGAAVPERTVVAPFVETPLLPGFTPEENRAARHILNIVRRKERTGCNLRHISLFSSHMNLPAAVRKRIVCALVDAGLLQCDGVVGEYGARYSI